MKMFVISDNVDTLTGMRLAGVCGVIAHEKEEFAAAVEDAAYSQSAAVLLVTEKLAKRFPEVIAPFKSSKGLPLVVEIPDRHGTGRAPDSITDYVRGAIGIKV